MLQPPGVLLVSALPHSVTGTSALNVSWNLVPRPAMAAAVDTAMAMARLYQQVRAVRRATCDVLPAGLCDVWRGALSAQWLATWRRSGAGLLGA